MCVSPNAVADCFLKLSWAENKPITQMKLQKLLFFAHGWHLALLDEPMMNELVQAWKYGPVFESIYHNYKIFGSNPIDCSSYYKRVNSPFWRDFGKLDKDLHKNVIAIVQNVWNVFKDCNAIQLMQLTHVKGSPWDLVVCDYIAHNGITISELPHGLYISNDIIKKYFKQDVSDKRNE